MGPIRKQTEIFHEETSVQLATAKEPERGTDGNGGQQYGLPPVLAEVTPEQAMLRLAIENRAPIETIERMVALMKEERSHQARIAFDAAMKQFKSNPPTIVKNKHVHYATKAGGAVDYNHATLDQLCDGVIKPLAAVGITHSWKVMQTADLITVTCLLKGFGHSEEVQMMGVPDTSGDKSPLKAFCSTVTHLQRYTLFAACGLAAGEDDETENHSRTGMESSEVEKAISEISQASDAAKLKFLFTVAYGKAEEAHDPDAKRLIIAAKDKRKQELANASH